MVINPKKIDIKETIIEALIVHIYDIMKLIIKPIVTTILLSLVQLTYCAPLTLDLLPGKPECLYLDVPADQCMIKYYFNIQDWSKDDEFVNYKVYFIPNNQNNKGESILIKNKQKKGRDVDQMLLITKENQRIGEWQFKAAKKGEYKVCYESESHKIIDIDISYDCSELMQDEENMFEDPLTDNTISLKKINDLTKDNKLNELITGLDEQVSNLRNNLDYYKLRNSRNLKTVESTLKRITWFSLGNILLIASVCVLQIVLLNYLFKKGIASNNTNKRYK